MYHRYEQKNLITMNKNQLIQWFSERGYQASYSGHARTLYIKDTMFSTITQDTLIIPETTLGIKAILQ
jgi:hypothetical protein